MLQYCSWSDYQITVRLPLEMEGLLASIKVELFAVRKMELLTLRPVVALVLRTVGAMC